jgi:hypothetical protein
VKPLVRLYPIDINRMPWRPLEGITGASERVLAEDPETGSVTRYLNVDSGSELPGASLDRWEETYVTEGAFECGGQEFAAGSYLCRPPGSSVEPVRTATGFVALQVRDVDENLDKPSVELTAAAVESMAWGPTASGHPGHTEKILARGPSGSHTRLLLIAPGADTTVPDDHDDNEEVLILEGSCRNGEEFHPAGTYTFNPPHSVHGPFLVDEPLLCFEVKNQP